LVPEVQQWERKLFLTRRVSVWDDEKVVEVHCDDWLYNNVNIILLNSTLKIVK
jgi:hypothetical protein